MFEFTLPVSGKRIVWKPLDVGQQLDLSATYSGQQQSVYLPAALYAARIKECGDKQGCQLSEIKTWDEIDYASFSEQVDRLEYERFVKFRKVDSPILSSHKLQKAVSNAREAIAAALSAMDEAVKMANAAESGIPLVPKTS